LITYSEENVEDAYEESSAFFNAHKDEFSAFGELKADVDIDALKVLQNEGVLVACVARHDDRIVGYCVDVLSESLQYKGNLFANTLSYYILPEYRARCGRGLLRFVEKVEREVGVYARITGYSRSSPSSNRSGDFLRALGYSDLDATLLKRL
jgi:GNAT superfamily N-acetyltransferase